MAVPTIYLWKKVPALRLILPFTAGVLCQWYVSFPLFYLGLAGFSAAFTEALLSRKKGLHFRFRYGWYSGLAQHVLFFILGCLALVAGDIRQHEAWFGHRYEADHKLVVTLEEPLVEKPASYKAVGTIEGIAKEGRVWNRKGKVLLYFKKDSAARQLGYGSRLVVHQPLDRIKNSGNPGSFDYQRYSLFQGLTHQAFLYPGSYTVLAGRKVSSFRLFLYNTRARLVAVIRKNILGRREQGLAEALLIGYRDDLDKTLVQSYANTGVVHIIAISGLHLGLIYGLLMWLTTPLRGPRLQWWRLLLVVSFLWLFSLLAGAQPSVLRAALMFSALAASSVLARRPSVYNTLALSALLLLCWNPFWLWDVGFQLSYLAVLGILLFFRPVYKCIYLENKILDGAWRLLAGSLAAQVLTFPVAVYHFHQFPALFLPANLVAVPLSSLILYGEILLCLLSFIDPLAAALGSALGALLRFLNAFVEQLDAVSFATWDSLSLSVLQTVLLYGTIAAFSYGLYWQKKGALWAAGVFALVVTALRTADFIHTGRQRKLIVYNVPRHQSLDLIEGRQYRFVGDPELSVKGPVSDFHLQPSRILNRVAPAGTIQDKAFSFYGRQVLLADTSILVRPLSPKPTVDLLVLSRNPALYLRKFAEGYHIRQVVIDGSVPSWKAKRWQQDCEALRIPCHYVVEKGAFVLNL